MCLFEMQDPIIFWAAIIIYIVILKAKDNHDASIQKSKQSYKIYQPKLANIWILKLKLAQIYVKDR